MEFKNLNLIKPILDALEKSSYQHPTPIQQQAIPAALEGRDILGLAQTGTGKTAAFALPVLQYLTQHKSFSKSRSIRALILTPTRELAIQIQESFVRYGMYLPLKTTVIFGGVGQQGQVKALKSGVDVLVATPGRLKDLIQQGFIKLDQIEMFVLDEADRMLDMGFIHDVRHIIRLLPKKKQTLLFSATMPKEIVQITRQLMDAPVEIKVTPVSSTVESVSQSVYFVDKNHKVDLMCDLLKKEKMDHVLVFTRTKHGANRVVRDLDKKQIKAQAIHGNKSQNARQEALSNFKSGKTQVLVATDIASRGIDVHDLGFVINYDLPEVPETYVHRIGRTGRAGQSGIAITLCTHQDKPLLKDIETLIRKKIEVLECPQYEMKDFSDKQKKSANAKPKNQGRSRNNIAKNKKAKPVEDKGNSHHGRSKKTRN